MKLKFKQQAYQTQTDEAVGTTRSMHALLQIPNRCGDRYLSRSKGTWVARLPSREGHPPSCSHRCGRAAL